MGHTPSAPKVTAPASATDPRFSTSGILNAQIKEQNRQGILSTFGGRTGQIMDINKFANKKIAMRDPSAMPILEKLSKLYANVATKSKAAGVGNKKTSSESKSNRNIGAYNASVDQVNNVLSQYGVKDSQGMVKAESAKNYDKRDLHAPNYGASNQGQVASSVASMGKTGQTFNDVEAAIKGGPTKKKNS